MSLLADDRLSRRELIKRSAVVGSALSLPGLSTVLSACGGDQSTSSGGKVQLQFWDMVWGPPEYIDTAKKIVGQFNQLHSTIQVNYQSVPWNNWYQTFTTAIGAGTAPDISTGAGYQSVQFYDSGAILPIDDVIDEWKKNGKLNDFQANAIDTLKYNGHYVSLPWGLDTRVMYYRKDFFAQANLQPPTNWDELKTAAKKLTGNGKYGMVCSSDTGGTHYLYFLMLNNGGGLFTADKKANLMSGRNQEAVQFFSDIVKSGAMSPASNGYQSPDAVKAFGRGDAALIISTPGMLSELSPDVRAKVGLLPPLTAPHGDKGTVRWVNNIMLYKQSKHPDEAKTFLKWWSENQKGLWTDGHSTEIPVRTSFANDTYFKNNEVLNFIIQNWIPVGKTTATASPAIFPQLNAVEGEGVMQTLVQDLLQGKNPIQALQTANNGVQSLMDKSA